MKTIRDIPEDIKKIITPNSNIKKLSSVDLIASGYEWECPECGGWIVDNEIPEDRIVECSICRKKFEIGIINHAHEVVFVEV